MEAGIRFDKWQLYTEIRTILENVPLLICVGFPSVIVGIILVIKGTQEWLAKLKRRY